MRSLDDERWVEEIRTRLARVRPDDRARWGVMSAGEMVVHLREAFRVGAGTLPVAPVKGLLPPAVMKWLGLSLPMRWPQNVPTVPELKRGRVAVPGEFEVDLVRLDEALEAFLLVKENCTPHAIFGTMQPKDWMRWGYLHTDHHLRQFGR